MQVSEMKAKEGHIGVQHYEDLKRLVQHIEKYFLSVWNIIGKGLCIYM